MEKPKIPDPAPQKSAAPKAPAKAPSAAPPGNPLTAAAGNGPSAYGLGVGNGGGDTVGGGGGGGGYGFYVGVAQQAIQAALKRNDRTRNGRFSALVNVWVGPGGQVTRVQVLNVSGEASSGDLEAALSGVAMDAPPAGMPLPIKTRINVRPS